MKRLTLLLIFVAALFFQLAVPAVAEVGGGKPITSPNVPSSGDLVENPAEWDGATIEFTGEAIAGAMVRGRMAWIHLNDDPYYLKNVESGAALGGYNSGHAVWLPAESAREIQHFGDYTHEGDVVTARGVFNAACAEHGGDMDIHATSLEVVVRGEVVREAVDRSKLITGLVLVGLAVLLWLANRRVQQVESLGPRAKSHAPAGSKSPKGSAIKQGDGDHRPRH